MKDFFKSFFERFLEICFERCFERFFEIFFDSFCEVFFRTVFLSIFANIFWKVFWTIFDNLESSKIMQIKVYIQNKNVFIKFSRWPKLFPKPKPQVNVRGTISGPYLGSNLWSSIVVKIFWLISWSYIIDPNIWTTIWDIDSISLFLVSITAKLGK